jgi:hypothetical protein
MNRTSHASIINLLKYDERDQSRDFRWADICASFTDNMTMTEIYIKIKKHQDEIDKLVALTKELNADDIIRS